MTNLTVLQLMLLITALQLPPDCRTTAGRLPDDCLTFALQLTTATYLMTG